MRGELVFEDEVLYFQGIKVPQQKTGLGLPRLDPNGIK
jgi:hypothetical protein